MDQGVIQNIKANYRSIFMRRCVNFEGTVDEFQKQFTLKDAIFALSLAWRDVKKKCLRCCWGKLWPMIIFEDSESSDEEFFGFTKGGRLARPKRPRQDQEPVSDILDLVKSSEMFKLDDEEVQAWVDIDRSVPVTLSLDDDEIIEQVLKKDQDEEQERKDEDNEDDTHTKKVTWKEADEGLLTFIRFAEQCSSMSAHDVIKLHCIHSEFLKLRKQSSKQTDIRSFMSCDKKS